MEYDKEKVEKERKMAKRELTGNPVELYPDTDPMGIKDTIRRLG